MISANGARTQPAFFRTYEQVRTAMFDLQRQYPDLVHVEDIGDSWQTVHGTAHRDVLALRLTSPKGGGLDHKPTTMWLGSVHPTELANPELLLRWAQRTAAGYGTDANATALLDGREIDMVPIVNVDGHASVEQGYATGEHSLQSKRKNNHEPDGIDLNRNFDFRWDGDGSSPDPKSSRYRGESPASEPETQAIQNFMLRRRPTLTIDWHSPGKDILYPWGWTKEPAPHAAQLGAIAQQFGRVSGYTPEQAINYSNTNGTTEDFAYGRVGAMAFTVETGPTSRQTQAMFERSWKDAAPIMDYAASITDAPGERAMGPGARNVEANGWHGVRARVSDAAAGGQAIQAAEAFLDPATPAGQGVPLRALDGTFDTTSERVGIDLAALHAEPGSLVQVRAQDADGHWGPATAAWVGR